MTADANLGSRPSSPLIAPPWHTIVFIAIFVGLSVVGGFFQHAVQQPQPQRRAATPVPGYISVAVFEWLRVLDVRMGVHKRGLRLRDLVGGRWATPKRVMKDIALGAGLWAVWLGLMNGHVLGGGTNARRGFFPEAFLSCSPTSLSPWKGQRADSAIELESGIACITAVCASPTTYRARFPWRPHLPASFGR
jgi:hypothetical protein